MRTFPGAETVTRLVVLRRVRGHEQHKLRASFPAAATLPRRTLDPSHSHG